MSVPDNLLPTHREKTSHTMKAPHAVKRINFTPCEADPGQTLNVHVPKLNENEVLHLSGGHANNVLIQNVSRALVSQLVVKFGGTILEDTVDYDIYKTFSNLFLLGEKRDNMVPEGIQNEDLCKIRSGSGDKKPQVSTLKKKMNKVYGKKYRINLNYLIFSDHGILNPQALYTDLIFEVTLASAKQVVKGFDPSKLKYRLTNIQLEYETSHSEMLANEARTSYI